MTPPKNKNRPPIDVPWLEPVYSSELDEWLFRLTENQRQHFVAITYRTNQRLEVCVYYALECFLDSHPVPEYGFNRLGV